MYDQPHNQFEFDRRQLCPPPLLQDQSTKKQLFEIFFTKDEKVNCGCYGKQITQCIHCNGTQKLSIDQEIQSEIEDILLRKIQQIFPRLQKIYAEKHKIQLQDINQFIDYHNRKLQQEQDMKQIQEWRTTIKSQSQPDSASKILPSASNSSSQRNSEIVQQQQQQLLQSQSPYLGRQSNQQQGRNSNSVMQNSGGITTTSQIGSQSQFSAQIVGVTPQQQQASSESSITFKVELLNNGYNIWPDNLKLKRIDDTDKLQEARVQQVAVGGRNITQIMIFTPKNEGKYTAKVKLTYTNEKGKEISFGPPINLNFEVRPGFNQQYINNTKVITEMIDAVIDFFDYDINRKDFEIEATKFYSQKQDILQLQPRKQIIEDFINYVNENYIEISSKLTQHKKPITNITEGNEKQKQ